MARKDALLYSLYKALDACKELLRYLEIYPHLREEQRPTFTALIDPLERILIPLSRHPILRQYLGDVIEEVDSFIKAYDMKLFQRVPLQELELLSRKARSWINKIEGTMETLVIVAQPSEILQPTITRREEITLKRYSQTYKPAYLVCVETGEKVEIPSCCIIGRNPFSNRIAIYTCEGKLLQELSIIDRFATRYYLEIGKQGHAKIYFSLSKRMWLIEDLNSTNGTRINDKLIPPQTPIQLKNNDIIEIGSTKLRIINS